MRKSAIIGIIIAIIVIAIGAYLAISLIPTKPAAPKPGFKKLCAKGGIYEVCIDYEITYRNGTKYAIIKDAINRTVEIKVPVKKVVIAFYPQLYLSACDILCRL